MQQDFTSLQKQLIQMRNLLAPSSSFWSMSQLLRQQSLGIMLKQMEEVHEGVARFLKQVVVSGGGVKRGQEEEENKAISQEQQNKIVKKQQQQLLLIVKRKIPLYYFQLLNLLLINSNNTSNNSSNNTNNTTHLPTHLKPQPILTNLSLFSQAQARHLSHLKDSKAFKSFLIFYFNLVKRLESRKDPIEQDCINKMVFGMLEKVLGHYFLVHSENKEDRGKEESTRFREQTQWMGMIFQCLPLINWPHLSPSLSPSFLHNYLSYLQKNTHSQTSSSLPSSSFPSSSSQPSSFPSPPLTNPPTYHLLHMLGNFLHTIIEKRTTTELVNGYQCPLKDVREMYAKQGGDKMLCNLKLREEDVLEVCGLLRKLYDREKEIFVGIFGDRQETMKRAEGFGEEYLSKVEQSELDYLTNINNSPSNKDHLANTSTNKNNTSIDKPNSSISKEPITSSSSSSPLFTPTPTSSTPPPTITTGQLLLQAINCLNCLLFLGGYTPSLQTLIYTQLFHTNLLPQFLELSYLIYTERRFMGKQSIKLSMAKPPEANLSKLLGIDYETYTKSERQAAFKLISEEIRSGQLSVLLRLMTNLVHINQQALNFFQENVKYLHMVMSLTHQSQFNLTMKNWAVLFIKNCCDSQKLRQEVGKIKIEMKVEE